MKEHLVLRPYQERARQRIIDDKCVGLFLDMGLGKTATTLMAINDLIIDRLEVCRCLVVAPLRVASTTWPDEHDRWDDFSYLDMAVAVGSKRARIKAIKQDALLTVINIENIKWLVDVWGKHWPYDMVVIDESSMVKSRATARFRALKQIRPYISRMVLLSGTPAPNGLMNLWSQIYLLDQGARLGKTITEYRRRYFNAGAGYGHVVYKWLPKQLADKAIHQAISDICVSMKTEDYIDLPPAISTSARTYLSKEEMETYKNLEHTYVLEYLNKKEHEVKEISVTSAAALSMKLTQIAQGFAYADDGEAVHIHRQKLDTLHDIIDEAQGQNFLVFYWFKEDLKRLQKEFPKARELKTPKDIADWNAGKISMLLAHPASCGHGLNLQRGGCHAVWFGLTWSLELYMQANKRLHRPGQTKPVIITHIIAKGTIDERIMQALEAKRKGQDAMLEAIKDIVSSIQGKQYATA